MIFVVKYFKDETGYLKIYIIKHWDSTIQLIPSIFIDFILYLRKNSKVNIIIENEKRSSLCSDIHLCI